MTTSPSYHLLASADAAVRSLAATGRDELGVASAARRSSRRCCTSASRPRQLQRPACSTATASTSRAADKVKTTIALTGYEISGFAVSQALVERGIVVEGPRQHVRAIDDRPVMHPYHARRYAKAIGQEVPLDQAVGRVAAEEVEVYPPGIPVILEGFRVSEDAVRYLREARDLGGAIVARDTSLATLQPAAGRDRRARRDDSASSSTSSPSTIRHAVRAQLLHLRPVRTVIRHTGRGAGQLGVAPDLGTGMTASEEALDDEHAAGEALRLGQRPRRARAGRARGPG